MTRSPVTPHWRWLERLLWFTAVGLLAFSAFMIFAGEIYQFYLKSQFQDALNAEQLASARRTPEFLKSASAVARSAPEPYIGRVDIPRLDLSVMLLDGVDDALHFGLGHIPGTALPGQSGNIGIAGHRDTFFRRLAGIRKDDEITVKTLAGDYRYIVNTIRIVDPENVEVLEDSGHPMLTLVTCYPFHLVGPAPKRFVVQASLK
jgi:LPXTG-site transpeptidase (sortase) family protein